MNQIYTGESADVCWQAYIIHISSYKRRPQRSTTKLVPTLEFPLFCDVHYPTLDYVHYRCTYQHNTKVVVINKSGSQPNKEQICHDAVLYLVEPKRVRVLQNMSLCT